VLGQWIQKRQGLLRGYEERLGNKPLKLLGRGLKRVEDEKR
jgi:hypothetical protein